MSKVKWVLHTNLTAHELQYANGSPMGKQIPVIPLADLAEVVEGLRGFTCVCAHSNINGSQEWDRKHEHWCPEPKSQRLLTQLEGYTTGGA